MSGAGSLAYSTSTTKGLNIDWTDVGTSTNYVGIAISAPYNTGTPLNGVVRMNRGTANVFNGMEIGTYTNHGLRFITNATTENGEERMRITPTGTVGIGTTGPSYKLDVNGDVNIAAANVLRFGGTQVCASAGCTASSDARLKRNIQPLGGALASILKLQGVRYDWKDKAKYGTGNQIGFIAQDLEKVFPEVVITDPRSGLKSVAYDHLVAPIVESIKALFAMVTSHEERFQNLEIENKTLKSENAAIKSYLCAKDPTAPFCANEL